LLADPEVTVEVVGAPGRLDVYLAHDGETLRHLGVRPERWGEGLAQDAVDRATGVRRLWVLEDNDRARGFYAHLGWSPTGRRRTAEWPPYPVELEYAR
jgi:GNAT superfamily N-acetyltransferase